MNKPKNPCILYLSSYPPRECGIATFTQDLTNAIDKEFNPDIKSKIMAINDNGTSFYNYPRKVVKQIRETEMEDYINRANEINKMPDIKLVSIQHEYGLYGGEQGEYLMAFLELLKKPSVITMHTVLPRPDEKMMKVGKVISDKCSAVIVMTEAAKEILSKKYGINKHKVKVIPHGVHHIAFPSKSRAKKKLGLQGKIVLSTFGMISRDKGIEYAIEALPQVVEQYPNVLYLILGATHPVVRREEGEVYRNKLKKLVVKHKLADNVKFYNKYLELGELIDYLKATDIYLYPMLSKEQASSGSLSYALSCGCPIITTKSQYAKSVVNEERGRLVKFKNSNEIEKYLFELIPQKQLRKEMKKNAYFYSRHMTWQNVALSYFNVFNHFAKIRPQQMGKFPPIKLDYIKALTDKFGMIQFANHTKPDIHSGYCVDDNARALLATAKWYGMRKTTATLNLIKKYYEFIKYCQTRDGKFHNFVNYQREFNDKAESEDSFGRAIWALGYGISANHLPDHIRGGCRQIFNKALKHLAELRSLRANSFALVGLSYILEEEADEKLTKILDALAYKLVAQYRATTSNPEKNGWLWFEDCLTYSNYKLPEALFRAYRITKNKEYLDAATKTLGFLDDITFEKKEYFAPIGQDGWYFRNGKRAYFDQQPEDAATAVEAQVAAFEATGKARYKHNAEFIFNWFLGKNHLNQMVYDEATGGSYDGLGKYSLNFNQGAESSISYLIARLAMAKLFPNNKDKEE